MWIGKVNEWFYETRISLSAVEAFSTFSANFRRTAPWNITWDAAPDRVNGINVDRRYAVRRRPAIFWVAP